MNEQREVIRVSYLCPLNLRSTPVRSLTGILLDVAAGDCDVPCAHMQCWQCASKGTHCGKAAETLFCAFLASPCYVGQALAMVVAKCIGHTLLLR